MPAAGSIIAFLILAGTPEAPRARAEAKPIASAVDLGAKWGIVTSVRRSREHNRAVGGAENSFHLFGRAVDIARHAGVRHSEVETAYRKAGYILVESLDEGDHSHFAFGIIGPDPQPDLGKSPQFAANAVPEKEECATDAGSPFASGRRRPDRAGDCPAASEPAPRLRPLEPAP